jgi:hypothetical protein
MHPSPLTTPFVASVKGTETIDHGVDQPFRRIGPLLLGGLVHGLRLVFLLLRRVLRLMTESSSEVTNTEVEVAVLRHQRHLGAHLDLMLRMVLRQAPRLLT